MGSTAQQSRQRINLAIAAGIFALVVGAGIATDYWHRKIQRIEKDHVHEIEVMQMQLQQNELQRQMDSMKLKIYEGWKNIQDLDTLGDGVPGDTLYERIRSRLKE